MMVDHKQQQKQQAAMLRTAMRTQRTTSLRTAGVSGTRKSGDVTGSNDVATLTRDLESALTRLAMKTAVKTGTRASDWQKGLPWIKAGHFTKLVDNALVFQPYGREHFWNHFPERVKRCGPNDVTESVNIRRYIFVACDYRSHSDSHLIPTFSCVGRDNVLPVIQSMILPLHHSKWHIYCEHEDAPQYFRYDPFLMGKNDADCQAFWRRHATGIPCAVEYVTDSTDVPSPITVTTSIAGEGIKDGRSTDSPTAVADYEAGEGIKDSRSTKADPPIDKKRTHRIAVVKTKPKSTPSRSVEIGGGGDANNPRRFKNNPPRPYKGTSADQLRRLSNRSGEIGGGDDDGPYQQRTHGWLSPLPEIGGGGDEDNPLPLCSIGWLSPLPEIGGGGDADNPHPICSIQGGTNSYSPIPRDSPSDDDHGDNAPSDDDHGDNAPSDDNHGDNSPSDDNHDYRLSHVVGGAYADPTTPTEYYASQPEYYADQNDRDEYYADPHDHDEYYADQNDQDEYYADPNNQDERNY